MKICLPFEAPVVGGGGYRVLRLFEDWLTVRGIPWTRALDEGADVLFVNSWHTPVRTIFRAIYHNPAISIVHRVGGAYYGRTDGAEDIQAKIARLADVRIFQSWFSRGHSGCQIDANDPVIYNPVDTRIFSPNGPRANGARAALPYWPGKRFIAVGWSPNPMKGWEAIYHIAESWPKDQFVLCGRYPDPPQLKNIVPCGVLTAGELAATMRSCHALLSFAKNEACPNHVLEARACGLEIEHGDSGATPEVMKLPVETFTPEVAFPQYIKACEQALAVPKPTGLVRRMLDARCRLPKPGPSWP